MLLRFRKLLRCNIFDLLVAVPAGVLVAGVATVHFDVATPLMTFLGAATLVLILLLRARLDLTVRESWALVALYVLFVGAMALETLGVLNWIGGT